MSARSDFNDLAAEAGNEVVAEMVALAVSDNKVKPPTPASADGTRFDEKSKTTPFKAADISGFLAAEPPEVDWFIRERIESGRASLISGLGGSSKTRLLYHLAIGACTGRLPWGWDVGKVGKAVLLLNEDRPADVHRIVHGMCAALELDEADRQNLIERLVVYPMAGNSLRLLMVDGTTKTLVANGYAKELSAEIKRLGDVVLVGLDPALSITPGDENDQSHQRALGKLVDDLAIETGAAVILVAHAAKTIQGRDEMESHSSRGGGAITDAVRAEMVMRAMTPKEAKSLGVTEQIERRRHVQLAITKANNCPPEAFTPVWLRRGEYGALSAAALDAEEATKEPSLKADDWKILGLLKEMCNTRVPKLKDWRDEAINKGYIRTNLPAESQVQAMKRTITRLMDAGEIKAGQGRGIYVPNEVSE